MTEVITTQPREIVQFWNTTTDAWEVVQNVVALELHLHLLPGQGISRASLLYRYGEIATKTGGFATRSQIALNRTFVRISCISENGPQLDWAGLVVSVEDVEQAENIVGAEYGDQILEVVGAEWLLSRIQIVTSQIATGDTTEKEIGRGLTFNARSDARRRDAITAWPNRDQTNNAFARDGQTGITWTAENIVDYVFEHYFPTLEGSAWSMAGQTVLDWYAPQIQAHGRSIFDIFNDIASPRRAINWRVTYNPAANAPFGRFEVAFATSTAVPISLPGGGTVPANPIQATLQPGTTHGAKSNVVEDTQLQYERVICTGARRGVVGTFSYAEESLEDGWVLADETAYLEGASMEPDYPDDLSERYDRNASLRSDRWGHVFTRFVVRTDGTFDLEGTDFFNEPTYVRNLRFERTLPLLENWDYSVDPPVAKAGARDQPDTLKLFAIYEITGPTYVYADKTKRPNEIEELTISSRVVPLENEFGVAVVPSKQPHQQALGVSNLIDADEETPPEVDHELMRVTGYVQGDSYVSAHWPVTTPPVVNFMTTELTIQLGESARYDILKANTVVAVEDGKLVQSPGTDVVLQDDRDYLRDVARMAFEWYGVPRYASNITFKRILTFVQPGTIVANIDSLATDSVTTRVGYRFATGETTISTAYATPDFGLIASSRTTTNRRLWQLDEEIRRVREAIENLPATEAIVEDPKEARRAITSRLSGQPYPEQGPFWPIRFQNSSGAGRQVDAVEQFENLAGSHFIPENEDILVYRVGRLWFAYIPEQQNSTPCSVSETGQIPLPVTVDISGIVNTTSTERAQVLNARHVFQSPGTGGTQCVLELEFPDPDLPGEFFIFQAVLQTPGAIGPGARWQLNILGSGPTGLWSEGWESDQLGTLTADPTQTATINNPWDATAPVGGVDTSAINIVVNPEGARLTSWNEQNFPFDGTANEKHLVPLVAGQGVGHLNNAPDYVAVGGVGDLEVEGAIAQRDDADGGGIVILGLRASSTKNRSTATENAPVEVRGNTFYNNSGQTLYRLSGPITGDRHAILKGPSFELTPGEHVAALEVGPAVDYSFSEKATDTRNILLTDLGDDLVVSLTTTNAYAIGDTISFAVNLEEVSAQQGGSLFDLVFYLNSVEQGRDTYQLAAQTTYFQDSQPLQVAVAATDTVEMRVEWTSLHPQHIGRVRGDLRDSFIELASG